MDINELFIEKILENDSEFKREIEQKIRIKIIEAIDRIDSKQIADHLTTSLIDEIDVEELIDYEKLGEIFDKKVIKDLKNLWEVE